MSRELSRGRGRAPRSTDLGRDRSTHTRASRARSLGGDAGRVAAGGTCRRGPSRTGACLEAALEGRIGGVLTLLDSIPPYWGPLRNDMLLKIGDVDNDAAFNEKISPLYHVDKIAAPLLIGQSPSATRKKVSSSRTSSRWSSRCCASIVAAAALSRRAARRDGCPGPRRILSSSRRLRRGNESMVTLEAISEL